MSADQANAPLRRPSVIDGITGLRLLPQGAAATLVNMSPSGLLAESLAKLPVGSAVTVAFEGGFTPPATEGRVVRCEVAVMGRDGRLRHHIGIMFDTPLALDEANEAPAEPAPPHIANRW